MQRQENDDDDFILYYNSGNSIRQWWNDWIQSEFRIQVDFLTEPENCIDYMLYPPIRKKNEKLELYSRVKWSTEHWINHYNDAILFIFATKVLLYEQAFRNSFWLHTRFDDSWQMCIQSKMVNFIFCYFLFLDDSKGSTGNDTFGQKLSTQYG